MQGSQFANPTQVGLGATPKEGPMAIPFAIDFTAQTQYVADLTYIQQAARISMIQTVFVDNSLSTVPLTIFCATTQQLIKIAPGNQAYVSVVLSNKLSLTFSSTSGLVIPCIALNIAMNTYQWASTGTGSFTPGGALIVTDPALEAGVIGGYYQAREFNTAGDGATIIPVFSGTHTAQGTLTTTAAATLITGAPGWMLKTLKVRARPNTILGAAGLITATLAESGGATIATGSVFVGTAVPTGFTPAAAMIDLDGVSITSKVNTSNLTLTLSVAPTGGGIDYYATFAQTTIVGD